MSAGDAPRVLAFADTNVWLYALIETQDVAKCARARELIRDTELLVSTQDPLQTHPAGIARRPRRKIVFRWSAFVGSPLHVFTRCYFLDGSRQSQERR